MVAPTLIGDLMLELQLFPGANFHAPTPSVEVNVPCYRWVPVDVDPVYSTSSLSPGPGATRTVAWTPSCRSFFFLDASPFGDVANAPSSNCCSLSQSRPAVPRPASCASKGSDSFDDCPGDEGIFLLSAALALGHRFVDDDAVPRLLQMPPVQSAPFHHHFVQH